MGRSPKYSHHLQFQKSETPSRIENPSTSISESLTDARLPQELIIEILVRLPVKSLLKFKCVSKSWLYLISSPQFIKSHFSISSSREGEYLNHLLLITVIDPIPGIKQCSLYSVLHEPSRHVSDIEYPSQSPDRQPWIVGVVNGLVCLAINQIDLFLWNPALRKYKHLPSTNVSPEPLPFVNYGFGYDESNDDYKVVSLLSVNVSKDVCETEVKIYSLRADSWRIIDDLNGFPLTSCTGKYVNGKIYWYACEYHDSTRIRKIVSLDLVSEKYGELQQPDYEAGDYRWKFNVVGGRPSVLCDYDEKKLDLWVMDGVEESWSKVVSIPYDEVHPLTLNSYQQVYISSKGEIVLETGFSMLVYHSKKKEFRNIELGLPLSAAYYEVPVYVESMVSPN